MIDDDIDIEVKESDLKIDTYRASGAGGQHVNTTDSAVRITHIPSGIIVASQNDRSQHKNRATAMNMLKARLYEAELAKREAVTAGEYAAKTEIGWGHQIRSYVLDDSRIKDLRTGVERSDCQKVLDGDLDELIDRYVASHVDAIKSRLLPIALDVLHRHREAGDRVVVATGAPPELARAILAFVAHEDVPVVGTLVGPKLGAVGAIRHCHHAMKMTMLREAGFTQPVAIAYTDSSADLPLLQAAQRPVVVNPKAGSVAMFREVLPPGTPILNWGCPGRAGDPVAPSD